MTKLTPETLWSMEDKELLKVLDKGLLDHKSKEVRFYAPSFMYYKTSNFCSSPKDFPTISVTGKGCGLKCKHCGGLVLETMYPANSPETLFKLCSKLKREGAKGCLISGGCLPNGSVPLKSYAETIKRVKSELGLIMFVHSGIINFTSASALADAGVDAVLIDIVGSSETIREIYNLDVTVRSYESSLKALDRASVAYVPHVVAGLHYGTLKGELNALRMISRHKPSALVIIAFMAIRGTQMADVEPPTPENIVRVIAIARSMFADIPLVLGCMRPKGTHRTETDILALKAGVDGIAFPSERTVQYAVSNGYAVSFSPLCCSQIYVDIARHKESNN